MLQIKNTLGGGKPEGLYVWKKYKYNPPVTVSNPSITITCPSTSGNKLNITSADIDIKTLWEDLWSTSSNKDLSRILTDAYGNISEWKSSSGISIGLASSMTSKIGFVSKNGTDGISYLYKDTSIPTYCVFVMGASSNFSVYAGTYTFNGEYKISDSSVEFIDYVVSDKETAYPDGGVQDGFYYEKVSEGITPEMFGCSKIAVDEFIPTANGSMSATTVQHSLGEIPKAVIIADTTSWEDYYKSKNSYIIKLAFIPNFGASASPSAGASALTYHYYSSVSKVDYTNATGSWTMTTNTIKGSSDASGFSSYAFFMANHKYTIITMA